jgi:hypothetical protein
MSGIRPGEKPLCDRWRGHVWMPISRIAKDPLPWWKRLFFETRYCVNCGAEKVCFIPEDGGL